MLSWAFGSKKQPGESTSGTGYGGDWTDSGKDRKNRIQGRKEAAEKESKRDAAITAYLNKTRPSLKSSSVTNASRLVSTLKETFRNQVPSDWVARKTLLLASLACFRLVILNYSELLGDKDDAESLIAAFDEFAQPAHLLEKQNGGGTHAQLVKEVLEVQSMMVTQRNTQVDLLVMDDPHEHYRKVLRPLRFDFVDALSCHHFASKRRPARLNMRKLFHEISSYKTSLPIEYGSSIIVRTTEGRLDLLRALILGPEDTPYANGCFFFDIYLGNYPNEPPKVQFLTTGGGKARFNPNLYPNGKVCLSLLGTWFGPGWTPGESTLLQVLVSIQALIFVNDPIVKNEPLLSWMLQNTAVGKRMSDSDNAYIRKQTLQHAILPFLSGNARVLYPEFSEVIEQHFRLKKARLEQQMQQWMAADDSSLKGIIVQKILPQIAQLDAHQKSQVVAKAPKVASSAVKRVESLKEGESPARKKQKVEVLKDGDSKPAAVVR